LGSGAIGSLQIGFGAIGFTVNAIPGFDSLLTSDGLGVSNSGPPAQWGIYKDGQPVVEADSCIALDFRKEWVISGYQIEGGKFESYNKVEEPYSVTVRMATGGSEDRRNAFLQSIVDIAGDYEFYDVVMSDFTFVNANITTFDFRRTNNQGVGLIQVDIRLEEIRTTEEAAFSSTKQPTGAGQKNDGTVQTSPPTTQQQSILSSLGI